MLLESLCKQLELLFADFWKRCSNCLQRDPNDIHVFALKDKEKIALKIGLPGFSIFRPLFEFSLKKHVSSDKNKLENHSLENQMRSLTEY